MSIFENDERDHDALAEKVWKEYSMDLKREKLYVEDLKGSFKEIIPNAKLHNNLLQTMPESV